ncbi:hypothetical protein BDW62DRAFT_188647 [Aspergillus aurantiobrunneus]
MPAPFNLFLYLFYADRTGWRTYTRTAIWQIAAVIPRKPMGTTRPSYLLAIWKSAEYSPCLLSPRTYRYQFACSNKEDARITQCLSLARWR